MIRYLVAIAAFGVMAMLAPIVAMAQGDEASSGQDDSASEHTETQDINPIAGKNIAAKALATITALTNGGANADGTPGGVQVPAVVPRVPAGRANAGVSVLDQPCAEWSDGMSDGGAVAPLGADEQASQDAAAEAARREAEGATSEEILTAINANNDDSGGSPMSAPRDAKDTPKSPTQHAQPAPAQTQPSPAQPAQPLLQNDHDEHTKAATDLLNKIAAEETAAAEAAATGGPLGDSSRTCITFYHCAGERVDDAYNGYIDSEPAGAFREYAQGVGDQISAQQATIRDAEASPPGGAEAPDISDPASQERVLSLATSLAKIGLGDSTAEHDLPVFNYCRIGAAGPIETATDVDAALQPNFTWTRVQDEFDLPASSADIYDQITRTLNANLPAMRTIPPIETGETVIHFPMWLWLDEPFTHTQFAATSSLDLIRLQGRATFDHVTWTLGDTVITCTLDDMQEHTPDIRLREVEFPECLHIHDHLQTYDMTAAVTYRIEQQLATRRTTSRPFFASPWEPHPVNEYVTIESTVGPIRVTEIRSVNVPLDYQSNPDPFTAVPDPFDE